MKVKYVSDVVKKHLGVVITLVVLWLFFSLTSPYFFTAYNILNILNHMTITLILALGMVFVISSGGIDLSVGSTLGFTGIIVAIILKANVPPVFAVILEIGRAHV